MADKNGGGIYVSSVAGTLTVSDTTFMANTALLVGGAVSAVVQPRNPKPETCTRNLKP